MKISISFKPLYRLFKRVFRKNLEGEIKSILGFPDFVEGSYGIEEKHATSMSWETFVKTLFE